MNSNILTGCFIIIAVCITLLTVVVTLVGVSYMIKECIEYVLKN